MSKDSTASEFVPAIEMQVLWFKSQRELKQNSKELTSEISVTSKK